MFKASLALITFLASAAAQADQLTCIEQYVPRKNENATLTVQYDHKSKEVTAELTDLGVLSKFNGTFTTDHSVGSTLYTFDLVPAAKLLVKETYNLLPKPCGRGGCEFNNTEDFSGSKFTAELEVSGAALDFTCH